MAKLFYDTNALLELGEIAFKEEFFISQKTLEEIESIKVSSNKDAEVKYKARRLTKLLNRYRDKYDVITVNLKTLELIDSYLLDRTPDNIICATAKVLSETEDIIFVTGDLSARNIASKIFELDVKSVERLNIVTSIEDYNGYRVVKAEDVAEIYQDVKTNVLDCKINEFILVENEDEIVDIMTWTGREYRHIRYDDIENDFMGKVKPRNILQKVAFDIIQNKDITIKIVTGSYGTGKDFIMLANAINMIRRGEYSKLIWIRNNVEVKDSNAIGYLPGSMESKLLPYAMIIADQLGGLEALEEAMETGVVELQHIGFVRGRSYNNAIIYCSEAENMTKEQVKLLIGRVGENSALWMNGDYHQVDANVFKSNNGLISCVERLSGNSRFGYVKLSKVERSETARIADLLD